MKHIFSRNLLIISILIFFFSCEKSETSFSINGNVTGLSDSTVVYLEDSYVQKIDSSVVYNCRFELNGKLKQIEKLKLFATDKRSNKFLYTFLIIGNEMIKI